MFFKEIYTDQLPLFFEQYCSEQLFVKNINFRIWVAGVCHPENSPVGICFVKPKSSKGRCF